MFQARRENVRAMRDIPEDLIMDRQDWLNLIIIFVPILTILLLLLGNKDTMSTGWFAAILPGFVTQILVNATGDAVSAGWWAVAVLLPLLFLDPETRARPSKVLVSLADGGILVSRLFLLLFAVSIISAFLNESGLTGEITPRRHVLAGTGSGAPTVRIRDQHCWRCLPYAGADLRHGLRNTSWHGDADCSGLCECRSPAWPLAR